MPKALHNKLKRQAKKQHLGKDRENAYVYGTMNKIEKEKHEKSGKKPKGIRKGNRYNV